MHTLTEVLLVLFLALGIAWLAVDLARKLRQPASTGQAPEAVPAPAPATATPVVAPVALAPAPAALVPPPAPVPPTASQPAPRAPETVAEAGIPAGHLAAITAAVHHLFKGRARLGAILPAGPAFGGGFTSFDWAREGRRDIFSSHRVR